MGEIKKYKITRIEKSAENVKIFTLEPIDKDKHVKFIPCQWVFLHTLENDVSTDKRPYSIASSPSNSNLEFAIEMHGGNFTSKLDKLECGTILGVDGPYGHIGYKDQPKAAFLCGGTGIAPFISALRHINEKKLSGEFSLFYSARSEARILYFDELKSLAKSNPNIKIVITLTREQPPNWTGEKGRIDIDMIKRHVIDPSLLDWWLCGPIEMIKTNRVALEGVKTDPKRIRMEGWG